LHATGQRLAPPACRKVTRSPVEVGIARGFVPSVGLCGIGRGNHRSAKALMRKGLLRGIGVAAIYGMSDCRIRRSPRDFCCPGPVGPRRACGRAGDHRRDRRSRRHRTPSRRRVRRRTTCMSGQHDSSPSLGARGELSWPDFGMWWGYRGF
jgi:hypothetical protein